MHPLLVIFTAKDVFLIVVPLSSVKFFSIQYIVAVLPTTNFCNWNGFYLFPRETSQIRLNNLFCSIFLPWLPSIVESSIIICILQTQGQLTPLGFAVLPPLFQLHPQVLPRPEWHVPAQPACLHLGNTFWYKNSLNHPYHWLRMVWSI